MSLTLSSKKVFLIGFLLGLTSLILVRIFLVEENKVSQWYVPEYFSEVSSVDKIFPERIVIQKLGINAAVESVGMNSQREMDVPKKHINAGWFNMGPRPGEKGNAIIAGHVGWISETPAVFEHIYELEKGDKVTITNSDGSKVSFVIQRKHAYNPHEDATEVFVPKDDKAHLNLITCTGSWDIKTQSYAQRLVVFADGI